MTDEPEMRRADRQSWAIRFLVPIPAVVFLIVYGLEPAFASVIDEGVFLLVAGDVHGLRQWGHGLGFWAPLGSWLLMVISAPILPRRMLFIRLPNGRKFCLRFFVVYT